MFLIPINQSGEVNVPSGFKVAKRANPFATPKCRDATDNLVPLSVIIYGFLTFVLYILYCLVPANLG